MTAPTVGTRVLGALAVVLAGACIGERRTSDDDLLGRVDSPWPVRLEHVTGTGGAGLQRFRIDHRALRVASRPPRSVTLGCAPGRVDVAVDATAARVAYRCRAGAPWHLAYAPTPEKTFHVPPAPDERAWTGLAASEPVAWSRVPTLAQAAPHLLAMPQAPEVAAYLVATAGVAGLARALADGVANPPASGPVFGSVSADPWLDAARRLPAAASGPVQAALRARFVRPDVPAHAASRAAQLLDLDDPSLLDAVEARARAPRGGPHEDPHGAAAARLLGALLRRRPERAGPVACERVARGDRDASSFLVVAHTRTPCPAATAVLGEVLGERPCDALNCVQNRACTPDELARALATATSVPPPGAWSPEGPSLRLDRPQAVLAAALAQGPLPAGLARRLARIGYALEAPAGPSCEAVRRRGEPCRCEELEPAHTARRRVLCTLDPEATTGAADRCTFTVDDARRTITAVRHRCVGGASNPATWATCASDEDCCEGRRCRRDLSVPTCVAAGAGAAR